MDKISFENEKDADALMDELSPRVESASENSELASTVAIPLDTPVKDGLGNGKRTGGSKDTLKNSGKAKKKTTAKDKPAAASTDAAAVSVPVRHWFVTLMCMNIPIIGWIYLMILACSPSKGPRRDFAKAYLLYKLIFLLLSLAILAVAVHYGLEVLNKVLAYMEML